MTNTITRTDAYPESHYLVAQTPAQHDARNSAVVLLATDGNERSDGAARVALARADATGATLEVITVLQTEPVLAPESGYFDPHATLQRRVNRRRLVEEQLERVYGRQEPHSITVLEGNPAFTISRLAIERRAALVVVGLGRHNLTNRLLHDEIALQLARIARIPMLAVPGDVTTAPTHAVVALDFSDISVRAAQAAVDAVADSGQVDLVHVIPIVGEDEFEEESRALYERWALDQMVALEAKLVVPFGVSIDRVFLSGRPAPEVLGYAAKSGATLVSTGTHGRGFIARAIFGSVTTQLLRTTTCCLLTVPRDPLPQRQASTMHDAPASGNDEAPLAWSALLKDFTKRNLGRRTILEVDDLEIGAQAQEYNYPLLGVSFSDRDGRLDLMLGDRQGVGRHLARSMGSVVAVDVLTDGAGHDVALRIQHGASQTLLTFAA